VSNRKSTKGPHSGQEVKNALSEKRDARLKQTGRDSLLCAVRETAFMQARGKGPPPIQEEKEVDITRRRKCFDGTGRPTGGGRGATSFLSKKKIRGKEVAIGRRGKSFGRGESRSPFFTRGGAQFVFRAGGEKNFFRGGRGGELHFVLKGRARSEDIVFGGRGDANFRVVMKTSIILFPRRIAENHGKKFCGRPIAI